MSSGCFTMRFLLAARIQITLGKQHLSKTRRKRRKVRERARKQILIYYPEYISSILQIITWHFWIELTRATVTAATGKWIFGCHVYVSFEQFAIALVFNGAGIRCMARLMSEPKKNKNKFELCLHASARAIWFVCSAYKFHPMLYLNAFMQLGFLWISTQCIQYQCFLHHNDDNNFVFEFSNGIDISFLRNLSALSFNTADE